MAQITKSNIAQIRADIDLAMKAIYAKHGVDVTIGRISYNETNFRCKIEGNVRGASATAPATPKTAALPKNAWMLGKDFDETKTYSTPALGRIKVVGYNVKAFKYPFIVQQVASGKKYKVSSMTAKAAVAAGSVA